MDGSVTEQRKVRPMEIRNKIRKAPVPDSSFAAWLVFLVVAFEQCLDANIPILVL